MISIEDIQPLRRGPSKAASVCATGTAEGWDKWKTYCQVLAKLQAMPLAELNKMGLNRTDLPRVARETAYSYCA
ncbi:MAG: hypothetical protein ACWA47_11570 [Brevirhabdus sp.]